MKLLVVTTIYGRHKLTDFVFEYYKNIKKELKNIIDFNLLVCGSEGKISEELTKKHGFEYTEHSNFPLSQKHNHLFKTAKNYNPDVVILIGSDDLISKETFIKYKEFSELGLDYIGFKDLYMYDGTLYYWGGYGEKRNEETIGAGRFYSKNILDKCDWDLWGDSKINKGLDAVAQTKIKRFKPKTEVLSCLNDSFIIVDIKTSNNITEISKFKILETKSLSTISDKFEVDFNYLNKYIIEPKIIKNKSIYDLSILISTYENVEYLKECFDSIEKSIGDLNVEVLIGIDSCLKSREYVIKNNFPENFRFYFFEKNIGPYTVFNTLSNLSNSENIMFFGSDDIMGKEMVSDMIDGLKFADCVRSSYINFTNPSEITKNKSKAFEGGVFAIRKEIFNNLNGFEPWMCEGDSEFILRLVKNRYKIKISNKIDFYRRIHSNGLTSRKDTGLNSKLRHDYRKIYINKQNYGALPKKVTEKFLVLKEGSYNTKEIVKTETKTKSVNPLGGLFSRPQVEETKTIDYGKVNDIQKNRNVQRPERITETTPENKNSNAGMAKNAAISKKPVKPIGNSPLTKIGKDFLRI